MGRKRKPWSFSVGPYGARVRVYEAWGPGSVIWMEVRVRGCKPTRETLGTKDRAGAIETATARQAELGLGLRAPGKASVGNILDAFIKRQTKRAAAEEITDAMAKDQERHAAMWKAVLGTIDAQELTNAAIEDVLTERRAGLRDSHGRPVEGGKRRTKVQTVEELRTLKAAFRWAVESAKLIRINPTVGIRITRNRTPNRPRMDQERYEALRAVAEQVLWRIGTKKRVYRGTRKVMTYLLEVLDLAWSTGRRIDAILHLRYHDFLLAKKKGAPLGEVRWEPAFDKKRKGWISPLNQTARAAVDRIFADKLVGTRARWPTSPWCFPSPVNPAFPVTYTTVLGWLNKAEVLAGLPHLDWGGWHTTRRGWATVRKHFPLVDIAAAGGWSDTQTLMIYTQSDPAMVERVVMEPDVPAPNPSPK